MNQREALNMAKGLWGKSAAVRWDASAPLHETPAAREAHAKLRLMYRLRNGLARAAGHRAEWVERETAENIVAAILERRRDLRENIALTAKPTKANITRAATKQHARMRKLIDEAEALAPGLPANVHSYRATVGNVRGANGLQWFVVAGQGDTFESAFTDAGKTAAVSIA